MTAPPSFPLYQKLHGLVLGFHGCKKSVGESILRGDTIHLDHSKNKYDWLGNGIYFWENDPLRAWEFAVEGTKKPVTSKGYIDEPFVLGAVIDLGLCLNLSDRRALDELKVAHEILCESHTMSKEPIPVNKGANFGARFLDRAVIEMVHELRDLVSQIAEKEGGIELAPYETVRSAFPEGEELYSGAGFLSKNHIQIAVRENSCIKGYFRPIEN